MTEDAGVVLRDPPAEARLDLVHGALGEALCEGRQALAKRHERGDRLGQRRAEVDGVGDDAAGQRSMDLLGGVGAGSVLGFGGGCAEVRGDDDVVALEQRVLGRRLLGEDVERRAGDLARLQPALQGLEIDQGAAGAVDDANAVFHLPDRLGVDPVRSVSGVFGRWIVMKSARE